MEQPLFDSDTRELWTVLADPADKTQHAAVLNRLVARYPQSNLLHALSARAGNKELIKKAAVYYNNTALHRFVKVQEPLAVADANQIVIINDNESDSVGIIQYAVQEDATALPTTTAELIIEESEKDHDIAENRNASIEHDLKDHIAIEEEPGLVNFEANPPEADLHMEAEEQELENEITDEQFPGISHFEANPPEADTRLEAEHQKLENELVDEQNPGINNFEENPPPADTHLEVEEQKLENNITEESLPGIV